MTIKTIIISSLAFLLTSCSHMTATFARLVVADTFHIHGLITKETSTAYQKFLANAIKNKLPQVNIYINSTGGVYEEALNMMIATHDAYYQNNLTSRCEVTKLAASGAFGLLQSCTIRVMHSTATLITHEPRLYIKGVHTYKDLQAALKYIEQSRFIWNGLCRARLSIKREDYESRVDGKDWRMSADDAIKVNAVDIVIEGATPDPRIMEP
jgi:ATP-dependent protease ClpP protease subunit